MRILGLSLVSFFSVVLFSFVSLSAENFRIVIPDQVYRGAQPSKQDFSDLALLKVKTVLDLRSEQSLIDQESLTVTGLGMKFVSIPLLGPSPEKKRQTAPRRSAQSKRSATHFCSWSNIELLPVFRKK